MKKKKKKKGIKKKKKGINPLSQLSQNSKIP